MAGPGEGSVGGSSCDTLVSPGMMTYHEGPGYWTDRSHLRSPGTRLTGLQVMTAGSGSGTDWVCKIRARLLSPLIIVLRLIHMELSCPGTAGRGLAGGPLALRTGTTTSRWRRS